jgi:hypothetical protein
MKNPTKFILVLVISLTMMTVSRIFADSPFTPGNIVVLRIGDGTAALSSASFRVFLDEYTPSGTLVQAISVPFTGPYRLTMVGSNVAAGWITRSPDSGYLVLPGFDTTYGILSIQSTTSANVNRKLLRVDNAVNYFAVLSSTAFSTNNIRGACMNGNDYWAVGDGDANTNGVQYMGTGTPAQVTSLTGFTNLRVIDIHNNQLLHSQNNSTYRGISQVGTGLPITPGQSLNQLINNGPNGVSDAFAFSPDNTVCYLADERTDGNGGVQKWVNPGTGWTIAGSYTISCGTNIGARGLTVDWSGTYPVIYVSTAKGGSSGDPNNELLKIVDVGPTATYQLLASAGNSRVFRGVALAPIDKSPPVPVTLSVSGSVNPLENKCYNATQTITVAGNSNTFNVFANGAAMFIAGENIKFLPGTTVSSGGKLFTQIAPQGPYCGGINPQTRITAATPPLTSNSTARIYPNPTSGNLTVEIPADGYQGTINFSITGMYGNTVLSSVLMRGSKEEFSLHGLPPGVYFVMLNTGEKVSTVKIILTR